MLHTLSIKRNKEIPFIHHHPWIFSGALDEKGQNNIIDGECVKVIDYRGQFIAYGLFNSKSQIRVRLYSFEEDSPIDDVLIKDLINSAINLRKTTLDSITFSNACRLIFSEADGLSGLVVDKFADYLSIQFTSLALYTFKAVIIQALVELINPLGIYLRTEKGIATEEGLMIKDDLIYGNDAPTPLLINENGLIFEVNIETGQKTGFYVDQRDNRYAVRKYAQGKRCLDVCSYTGAFSMNLLYSGAQSVIAVDVSENALSLAQKNAELNHFTNFKTVKSDAFKFLENELKQKNKYDLIILDPPKFTHSRANNKQALKGYIQLNHLALTCLHDQGVLVTCSCSGRISNEDFSQALANASLLANRRIRLIEQRLMSIDHPVNPACPESAYLKCLIYWVD